jgi:hypothetical protein
MKTNKNEVNLEDLRKKLKWGDYTKIADVLGKTPQCVSNQLLGKTKNIKSDVIKAAIQVISEKKELINQLNKITKPA